jgi:hypothetical protein
MKNNRLIGIIAFIVAILLVGGLSYYEFTQVQPKSVVVGAPESDDMGPPGDKPIVPPASLTENKPGEGAAVEAPSAPVAADNGIAAAPATPALAGEQQAATTAPPAAETPAPAGDQQAATTEPPAAETPAPAGEQDYHYRAAGCRDSGSCW